MKALITGASSGIGKEIAKYLDKKGVSTVLVARRKDKLEEVKKLMKSPCEIICANVGGIDECKKIFEENKDVDILINNAGFGVFGKFFETDLERELNMIDVNIKAVHVLTKLYFKEFKQKNSGYILNVSSSASFCPGPLFSSYYASKAYVTRLTQAIAEEIKKDKLNVKISALCPGPVETEFNDVAGVKFAVGSITADYAAKCAVEGMFKGKTVITPGFGVKCLHFFSKLLPSHLCAKVVYKIQKQKMG